MDLLTGTRSRARGAANETDAAPLCMDQIRDLALRRPGTPVLSLYVRTDPRDPANTAAVPGWLVELRNSLRTVSREADERESRERRMAIRELRERVERDVLALEPARRGRGLAWFRTADGSFDHRFTLQLPPPQTLARWDDRPYISPLAEVAGRGRATGLVLVSAEAVRLLQWQDGRVTEPARSLYEIEPGQWRDDDAYVGYPGRSAAGLHVAEFDQRVSRMAAPVPARHRPGGRSPGHRPGLAPGPASRRTTGDRPVPPAATRTGVRSGHRHDRREPDLGRPRRGRRTPGRRPARRRPSAGAGTGRRDGRARFRRR